MRHTPRFFGELGRGRSEVELNKTPPLCSRLLCRCLCAGFCRSGVVQRQEGSSGDRERKVNRALWVVFFCREASEFDMRVVLRFLGVWIWSNFNTRRRADDRQRSLVWCHDFNLVLDTVTSPGISPRSEPRILRRGGLGLTAGSRGAGGMSHYRSIKPQTQYVCARFAFSRFSGYHLLLL